MNRLVYNAIQTPDGTILESKHRHDCVTYEDKNGHTYMVDGGHEYSRCNLVKEAPHKSLCLYENDDFSEIRKVHKRGGRGKNGDQPLTWTPLCEMNDNWLRAAIEYNEERNLVSAVSTTLYKRELEYRKEHNITIKE